MAAKGTEVLDPAALKAQHSVLYDTNTSEIKDDVAQLLAVMKSGHGPLTRQEAGFLTWYHALCGSDSQEELIAAGAVNVCLGLLDAHSPDVLPVDKTCAAGILVSLCSEDEGCEAVIKGRAGPNPACGVLHSLLLDAREAMQFYGARCLRLIAEQPAAKSVMLRAMEGRLHFIQLYRQILYDGRNSHVVTQVAYCLTALLDKRPDLCAEAIDNNLVEAALQVLQHHKADSCVAAGLKCLIALLEDRQAWGRVEQQGGVLLLVDVLGSPPRKLIDLEIQQQQKAALEKQRSGRLEQQRSLVTSMSRASSMADPADLNGSGVYNPALLLTGSSSPSKVKVGQKAARDVLECIQVEAAPSDAITTTLPRVDGAPPDSQLLSVNRSGLKWQAIVAVQTHCLAANCLYSLAQHTPYMHVMSGRCAASRLVPLLFKIMDQSGDAGKKGKKKGLSLSPDQTVMLVSVTGCLKFLSLLNVNRYRIAHLGAVRVLTPLYQECSHTLLRRNAQVVLSNLALLAENGQVLLDGGLPEEFLVPRPLRLAPQEMQELSNEFDHECLVQAPTPSKAAGSLKGLSLKA